jgi:S-DNA-T family DNA segregation ATPase FtsK/SpoIIIE
VGLELLGVALCLGGVVLAAALASYGPPGPGLRNVAGGVGRGLAGAMTRAVGVGVWVFPAAGIVWGLACVRGRSPRRWWVRALLLLPLAALLGAFGALLLRETAIPGLERSGPGGYVGVAFAAGLYRSFGRVAGLVVLGGVLGLLRLVTDVSFRRVTLAIVRYAGERIARGEAADAATLEEDEEWEEEEEAADAAPEPPAPRRSTPARSPDAAAPRPRPAPRAAPRPKKAKRKPPVRRQVGAYVFPPTDLLDAGEVHDPETLRREIETNAKVLGEALRSFGVEARVVSSTRGPVITFFEIAIGSGIRLNRVTALADDLAIALKAPSVRIVAPIPGRSTVGVEVPNLTRETVCFRDVAEEASSVADRKSLPVYIGRDTAGRSLVEDLATMPHILIAGATGSGKSVCINSILLSVLYTRTPDEVSLILIDPKQVELSFFEGIPHLLTPVVTDMKRAAKILEWAVDKMEERYSLLLAAGVRNIGGYNALSKEKAPERLAQVVIVVDELADLMMTSGKDVELAITRLAQKSRAVGIHIILATQRPSTNVITGLIKANMPTRIAFCVSSKIDSRVILDANGADKLLGMGDMLYMSPRSLHLRRAQGALVTDGEVRAVVDWLKANGPEPAYQDLLAAKREGLGDPMEEDDLYDDAVRAVLTTRLGSASMLQRRLSVGYTRASRLVDMMCDRGVVGPHVGSKAREVLLTLEEWEAMRAEERGEAPAPSTAFEDDDDDRCVDESWE